MLRELAPQVLGALARRYGDFDTAEDAVQEALLAASIHWPRDGVPDNPRAWLTQAASRRLIDQWRSEQSRRERESLADGGDARRGLRPGRFAARTVHVLPPGADPGLGDRADTTGGRRAHHHRDRERLPRGEATMAQRIARGKQRIKASDATFRMPTPEEQPARLRSVLRVLYLIFNEGYAGSTGRELQRTELSQEAIRLARMVHGMLPDDGEVAGLLALMLLVDARRPARTDSAGELIPLPEQDRTLWDQELIAEGTALLDAAIGKGAPGEYQLQAAITAVHDRARRADETDWPQILALYGLLEQLTGSPIVTLNRAVAAAMAEGPSAGLAALDSVEDELSGHYRFDAVRAHILEMAGETEAAWRTIVLPQAARPTCASSATWPSGPRASAPRPPCALIESNAAMSYASGNAQEAFTQCIEGRRPGSLFQSQDSASS